MIWLYDASFAVKVSSGSVMLLHGGDRAIYQLSEHEYMQYEPLSVLNGLRNVE